MKNLKPLVVAALGAAVLALPATAAAGIRLQSVDANAYPTVRATVVSSAGANVKPALRENDQPVADLSAQNLGCSKAVVLGVDRSRSMRGAPLADAAAAARSFVAAK